MKEKLLNGLKWFFNSFIWLGILIFVIDIITKNIIVQNAESIANAGGQNGGVDIIPGFLGINYVINKNVVFGWDVFKNETTNRIVFIVIALLISAIIIFFLIKKWGKINRFYKACLMLIVAGAIGNAIDRIFYTVEYLNYVDPSTGKYITGVVDWIDFYGIWHFNFNIADSAIVVAAIMLIIYMIVVEIIEYRRKAKLEPKKEVDNTKVISKTEQEKNAYLEDKMNKDE